MGKPAIYLSFALGIVTAAVAIIVNFPVTDVQAQAGCCNPPLANVVAGRFPINSNIVVTISSDFTLAERNDIIAALLDWNNHNTGMEAEYYLGNS
jgi:hypothetical protein